jgi:hypothetical protein
MEVLQENKTEAHFNDLALQNLALTMTQKGYLPAPFLTCLR